MNRLLDKILDGPVGEWCVEHPVPRWLAPAISVLSMILSVSAMALANR